MASLPLDAHTSPSHAYPFAVHESLPKIHISKAMPPVKNYGPDDEDRVVDEVLQPLLAFGTLAIPPGLQVRLRVCQAPCVLKPRCALVV